MQCWVQISQLSGQSGLELGFQLVLFLPKASGIAVRRSVIASANLSHFQDVAVTCPFNFLNLPNSSLF